MLENLYLRRIVLNRALPENAYWAKLPAVQSLAAQPLTLTRPVDYRQTSHDQLTRRFLENPAPMYRLLWERENKP